MGCGCRGSQGAPSPRDIVGYDYISPGGVSYRTANNGAVFMTLAEARAEQRAHGGGTIRAVYRSQTVSR